MKNKTMNDKILLPEKVINSSLQNTYLLNLQM